MLNYLLCKLLDFLDAAFNQVLSLSNYLTAALLGIFIFLSAAALRFSTSIAIYEEGLDLAEQMIAMNTLSGLMWVLFAMFCFYGDRWLILHELKDMKKIRIVSLIFAIACFVKSAAIALFMINYVDNLQLIVAVNYVVEIVAWICGGVFLLLLSSNIERIHRGY